MIVKAIELVLDWNLWPRHKAESLDSTNVARLKEAMRAGEALPPVIANKSDKRITDGFHRVRAALSISKNSTLLVEYRDYKSEKEMLLDAGRLNAKHGLAMTPLDHSHYILKCRRMKINHKEIAEVLGITGERYRFLEKRFAVNTKGEKFAISNGAAGFAGKTLTKKEEECAKSSNGMVPLVNARLLLKALQADYIDIGNSQVKDVLMSIHKEIHRLLGE